MSPKILASAVLVLLLQPAALAVDLVASDRLAIGLSGSGGIQGEIIELEADGDSFVAIFRAHQRGESRGGVILLHDQGTNANSHEVIRPLRLGLAEAGWDTLSLQLPLAHRGESTQAWQSWQTLIQARLQAGLDWLKARKLPGQVIVAQGDSGAIALQFASAKPPRELRALVLVSTPLGPDTADGATAAFGQIGLPVLDIYAERDRRPVLDSASARRLAAGEGSIYRQRVISGASAGFFALDDSLLGAVRAWLAVQTGAQDGNAR